MSIPHTTPGQFVNARPLRTGVASPPTPVEQDETIHKRGLFLSVMQAVALVVGFALLLGVVAPGIFVSLVSIVTVLVILGGLHYWVWGRWMPRA